MGLKLTPDRLQVGQTHYPLYHAAPLIALREMKILNSIKSLSVTLYSF